MLIEPKVLHDLKSERPDVTPPLPPYLRIVPFAFYGGVVATALLSAFYFFQLQNATRARDGWLEEKKRRETQLAAIRAERTAVEGTAKRASDVLGWVEGSRGLQSLVVDIARSMAGGSSIAELALDRDAANPSQINLTLRLNTEGTDQLDTTLETVQAHNFRTYSPNQTLGKGEMDYQATLIWQGASRAKTANE